jgi:hypothetical protein
MVIYGSHIDSLTKFVDDKMTPRESTDKTFRKSYFRIIVIRMAIDYYDGLECISLPYEMIK